MPLECLSSVLKYVDPNAPYELVDLNAVVYNKINSLESTAYANFQVLDVVMCESITQSEMCRNQYRKVSCKLGHLHILCCSLMRKTAEYYLNQIVSLKKEIEELKKGEHHCVEGHEPGQEQGEDIEQIEQCARVCQCDPE